MAEVMTESVGAESRCEIERTAFLILLLIDSPILMLKQFCLTPCAHAVLSKALALCLSLGSNSGFNLMNTPSILSLAFKLSWTLCLLMHVLTVQADHVRALQEHAITNKTVDWGYWGPTEGLYSVWKSHSNRLIPIYTFGMSLDSLDAANSIYRDAERLEALYGFLPSHSVNDDAPYFDQTDVYRLQKMAVEQGKKRIILMVFDGMDWQTTRAAAIYKAREVRYRDGRGTGLHFQDYRGAATDYGWFVTSPHNDGTDTDVNSQTIENPGGDLKGGYDPDFGGYHPWDKPSEPQYPISKYLPRRHAYTDSASSATSMTSGIKTYNGAINVDAEGHQVEPIARWLQREKGYAIGVVTSVPISHATPAAAYANNVKRDDYQDLTRDLLGLPSVAHPNEPLPGVDVLLGAGWGENRNRDSGQGTNYVGGNRYLAAQDLEAIDASQDGPHARYHVAQRTEGRAGSEVLKEGLSKAMAAGDRFFGYFGTKDGHLPYQTADGDYQPTRGAARAKRYSEEDVQENPTLTLMAEAALDYLASRDQPFWLMIEAGDVDWANHDNNLDNSIGAVLSGDRAFHAVTQWVEKNGGWNETVLLLTADHGHYFNLVQPEILIGSGR